MNYKTRTLFYVMIFLFFVRGNSYQTQPAMKITRGLENALVDCTELEQKLARIVAAKLEKKGFPVNEITRIYFKTSIQTFKEYYNRNEITFFINPVVSEKAKGVSAISSIGIGWTDPSVVNLPNGGIEFEVGRKINPEDLLLDLYAVSDHYNAPVKNQDVIIEKINLIFMDSKIQEVEHLTNRSLYTLAENYSIDIMKGTRDNLYNLSIMNLKRNFVDEEHKDEIVTRYYLDVDLLKNKIRFIKRMHPFLYPTPVSRPIRPEFKIIPKNK